MPEIPGKLPDFVSWPGFPFEGDLRVKPLEPITAVEPPRDGEDIADCSACAAPDEAYIWVSERWRVRATDRPTGLPMVMILESRSHLDLGDLPNLLAAELGVMTVRLERAIRSLDGVARVHVNRWGDGAAHLHLWFLARPVGQLQLRGSFLSLWNDILPPVPEAQWRENLALVAAWLAEFGGRPLAEPPRIQWQAPSTFAESVVPVSGEPHDNELRDGEPESDVAPGGAAPGGAVPAQGEVVPATGHGATSPAPSADNGVAVPLVGDVTGPSGALADAEAEPAVTTPSAQAATAAVASPAALGQPTTGAGPTSPAGGESGTPVRQLPRQAVPAPRTSTESEGAAAAAT